MKRALSRLPSNQVCIMVFAFDQHLHPLSSNNPHHSSCRVPTPQHAEVAAMLSVAALAMGTLIDSGMCLHYLLYRPLSSDALSFYFIFIYK